MRANAKIEGITYEEAIHVRTDEEMREMMTEAEVFYNRMQTEEGIRELESELAQLHHDGICLGGRRWNQL